MKSQESDTAGGIVEGARGVIFDAGNTLVGPDWGRISAPVEGITGRRFDASDLQRRISRVLFEADADPGVLRRVAEGKADPGWQFRRIYSDLEVAEPQLGEIVSGLLREHGGRHLWTALNADALAVIKDLKSRGKSLAVISNSEDGQLERILDATGIGEHFDLHLDSFQVGIAKPDPRIFLLAAERLGIRPCEGVYVGDMYVQDVGGARRAGLHAVLFDPLDQYPSRKVVRIRSLRELVCDVGR
jgi:HAD superfamily hydrolase (TIGR01509 family)